jgi:hypothetical protein
MSADTEENEEGLATLLERCCHHAGLNYVMLADEVGVLPFAIGDDSERIDVFITERGPAVLFHVRMDDVFSSLDAMHGPLLARLLARNARSTWASWALEEAEDGWVFALVHAVDRDSLTGEIFERIVHRLLHEHRRFGETVAESSPGDVQ